MSPAINKFSLLIYKLPHPIDFDFSIRKYDANRVYSMLLAKMNEHCVQSTISTDSIMKDLATYEDNEMYEIPDISVSFMKAICLENMA